MNTALVSNSPHYSALVKFLEGINAKVENYWQKVGFKHTKPHRVMVQSVGKKYARLGVYEDRVGNGKVECSSVYCFFDYRTGDLLKASGWSAPAPNGVRGNVNDANVLDNFNAYGPEYLY